MRKLLFFASDFRIGLSSLLTDQIIALKQAGVDVIGVAGTNEQEPGLGDILKSEGVNIERVPGLDEHNDFKRLVSEIIRVVIDDNIECIHVQNNWQLAIASAVRLRLFFKRRFKIVYTIHGFRNNSPAKAIIARFVIGSALHLVADHVICMTTYLKKKFLLLSYKIKLIRLGIKDDYFIESFVKPTTHGLNIVFPAQFRIGKNQDLLLRSFANYIKLTGDDKALLTLPGTGELLDKMKKLATELGISSQVIFPGFVSKDEIKRLYLNCNLAVITSNSETFGQSIVEPYVLGRCIASTPVGIAPEIINDNSGFIFSNESELTEILVKLSKNKDLLISYGENNFANKDQFRWGAITAEYIEKILR